MARLLSGILLVLFGTSLVHGDAAPMPPNGMKFVTVANEVILAKDVTGYVFLEQVYQYRSKVDGTYKKIDLNDSKARPMSPGGRRTGIALVAVPEAEAKKFKDDIELCDALIGKKIPGIQFLYFEDSTTISEKDARSKLTKTYTILSITEKGIVTKVAIDGKEPVKDKTDPATKKEEKPLALSDSNIWIAGIAAAMALMFAGVWVVRRKGKATI